MRNNDHFFIVLHFFQYLILPKWPNSIKGISETFNSWQNFDRDMLVFFIIHWMSVIVYLKAWWAVRVTRPPLVEGLLGDGGSWTVLLKALECTIVLLVEPIVLVMGDPVAVELLSDRMVSPNGSLKHRGISVVETVPMLFQNLASLVSLSYT